MPLKARLVAALITSVILLAGFSCSDATTETYIPANSSTPPAQELVISSAAELSSGTQTTHSVSAEPRWQLCTWVLLPLRFEPQAPNPGQTVTIWANIYIEDFPVSDVLTELLIDGEVVDRQTLTVTFDESWPFSFPFIPEHAGQYQVAIRAILAVNSSFADLPGGSSEYFQVSEVMNVDA